MPDHSKDGSVLKGGRAESVLSDDGLWFDPPDVDSGESIGSLLIHGDAPRDGHGHAFQVLLRSVNEELVGLVTDVDGWPLAWVHDLDAEIVRGADGRPALQRVPLDVAESARAWVRDQIVSGD